MNEKRFPERDYGYGDPPTPDGAPRVVDEASAPCPSCGCERVFLIKVSFSALPQFDGDPGVGVYTGCPACPWASPMVARRMTESDDGEESR